jgi:hypothetical protein
MATREARRIAAMAAGAGDRIDDQQQRH